MKREKLENEYQSKGDTRRKVDEEWEATNRD